MAPSGRTSLCEGYADVPGVEDGFVSCGRRDGERWGEERWGEMGRACVVESAREYEGYEHKEHSWKRAECRAWSTRLLYFRI